MKRIPRQPRHERFRPLEKVQLATQVLVLFVGEQIDEAQAGRFLREAGLRWSLLNAIQYLSGKQAREAIDRLPEDWSDAPFNKAQLLAAVHVAAHMVANLRSDGVPLCASELAASMKGKPAP